MTEVTTGQLRAWPRWCVEVLFAVGGIAVTTDWYTFIRPGPVPLRSHAH